MQALHVNLKEGEKIYADSGKLLSKSANVIMTPRLYGGVVEALERKATGITGFLTEFAPKKGSGSGSVSVTGVMPGKVKEITLNSNQSFVAEQYAFLAAEGDVKYEIQALRLSVAWLGGEGLILQKFAGPGVVFIHIVGDIVEYDLDGKTAMEVDPGHIAGYDSTLNFTVRPVDNIRSALFGGVGLFLATFTGTGRLFLHSVSRYKLASQMYSLGRQQAPKGAQPYQQ